MSDHLSRDELLGLQLDALEDERAREAREHLAQCSECRAAAGDVAVTLEGLGELRETTDGEKRKEERLRAIPAPVGLGGRMMWSTATPIAIMVVSLVLTALARLPLLASAFGEAALGPLVLGTLLVVVWLHGLVSRAERGWRETLFERDWRAALPGDAIERIHMVEGMRLSVLQSLTTTRAKVTRVLVMALTLFAVSAVTLLAAGLAAPAVAVAVTESRPLLLPGAMALGLLFAGVIWVSWRLVRVARSLADFVQDLAKELQEGETR